IWRNGIAKWEWAGDERVGRQESPVREIAGGFEDDDPIGLAGDVESKLVRDDTEADQGERLKFIRANVHGATDDAWVTVEVGDSGREGIQAGIDAGRDGLQPQITGGLVHE